MGASRAQTAVTENISVTDTAILQNIFSGGGTISSWIYVGVQSTPNRYFAKQNGSSITVTIGWNVIIDTTTPPRLIMRQAYASSLKVFTSANFTANVWNHIAITYDNTSSSNVPIIYFNGVSQSITTTGTGSGAATSDIGENLFISSCGGTDRGMIGKVAYAQVFDRIITNDEVYEIMYKPGSIRTNLVGYWPLIEDVRDLSGNGNNVTLTGGSYSVDGPPVTSFK